VADETDFNTQVERTLSYVTHAIVLVMKTPLLIVDLFRNSTLTSMITEGGVERRYLGPQTLLVTAFFLMVCEEYLPHRFQTFERKLLVPEFIEHEKFHYLLEFFLWFAIFSLVRLAAVYCLGLAGREKKFFEQIIGYATAVPLIFLAADQLAETLLIYVGWEKVSSGYPPEIDFFQLAVFALAALGIALGYPFALLYRAGRRVVALDPQHLGAKHPVRWALWRAAAGTAAVLASQFAFAWSPHFIQTILPPPLTVEILEMYVTSKPASQTTYPLALSLKITNTSDEDRFVNVSGMALVANEDVRVPTAGADPHKELIKIGKDSSEVILVRRSVQVPNNAVSWTVRLPAEPELSARSVSSGEPFFFWPSQDKCFGDNVTEPCATKVDNH
jgi:hypothetical protein